MLTGSVANVGGAFTVTAQLLGVEKGDVGTRLVLQSRRPEAIRKLEQAIVLDTAFASACNTLGQVYGSVAEPGRALAALRRAVAHQNRLPFVERTFAVASYAHSVGDLETAQATYDRALARYPDDFRFLNNLALIHRDRRRFAVAESLFARAAKVDSTIANFYFGMHSTQLLQSKFAASRWMLNLIARRFPGHSVLFNVEIQDASAQHHWEEAERRAEAAISAMASDTLQLVDPYEARGDHDDAGAVDRGVAAVADASPDQRAQRLARPAPLRPDPAGEAAPDVSGRHGASGRTRRLGTDGDTARQSAPGPPAARRAGALLHIRRSPNAGP